LTKTKLWIEVRCLKSCYKQKTKNKFEASTRKKPDNKENYINLVFPVFTTKFSCLAFNFKNKSLVVQESCHGKACMVGVQAFTWLRLSQPTLLPGQ
jgi:hypothetical protein